MLELVDNILGACPAGLEFLRYIFAFVFVVFGLFIIAYLFHLPFEFVSNRFHRKH